MFSPILHLIYISDKFESQPPNDLNYKVSFQETVKNVIICLPFLWVRWISDKSVMCFTFFLHPPIFVIILKFEKKDIIDL